MDRNTVMDRVRKACADAGMGLVESWSYRETICNATVSANGSAVAYVYASFYDDHFSLTLNPAEAPERILAGTLHCWFEHEKKADGIFADVERHLQARMPEMPRLAA
jgi:hypothetical protein